MKPWHDDRIATNGKAVRDNFSCWFAGSKAVDRDGLPLTLFHGSTKSFDTFDRKKARGWAANNALGHFFTVHPHSAGDYAGGKPGTNVMPVHLQLRNPFVMHVYAWQDMQGSPQRWHWQRVLELRRELIAKGHDGVVDSIGVEFIAFKAHQIKSALGNTGLFLDKSNSLTDSKEGLELQLIQKAKRAANAASAKNLRTAIGMNSNRFNPGLFP